MNAFRRVVVAALLAVWFFPAVSMAKAAPRDPAPLSAPAESTGSAVSESNGAQAESLATREQKARQLQDFKGGSVVVFVGSGTLIIVVIILLLLLV